MLLLSNTHAWSLNAVELLADILKHDRDPALRTKAVSCLSRGIASCLRRGIAIEGRRVPEARNIIHDILLKWLALKNAAACEDRRQQLRRYAPCIHRHDGPCQAPPA